MAKREERTWLLLSKQEKQLLQQAAKVAGMPLSTYLRSSAVAAAAQALSVECVWTDRLAEK